MGRPFSICHLAYLVKSFRNGEGLFSPACFKFSSVQFSSIQFNSVQISSDRLDQVRSVQFSSALDNTFTLTYHYSFQFSSIQFSSIQFRSVQISSVQFRSVQFSSIQLFYAEENMLQDLKSNIVYVTNIHKNMGLFSWHILKRKYRKNRWGWSHGGNMWFVSFSVPLLNLNGLLPY